MEGYAGLHQLISLYPADSKYSDEHWVVALMMPSQALNTLISSTSHTLIIGLLALKMCIRDSFYGDEITYPDNTKEKVEYIVLPYPTFEGGEKIAIQRGSGLVVAKSTPEKEAAATLFLKWFTSPEQNMRFVSSTGYLPVTDQAFTNYMEHEISENSNPNIRNLLRTATTVSYTHLDVYKRQGYKSNS